MINKNNKILFLILIVMISSFSVVYSEDGNDWNGKWILSYKDQVNLKKNPYKAIMPFIFNVNCSTNLSISFIASTEVVTSIYTRKTTIENRSAEFVIYGFGGLTFKGKFIHDGKNIKYFVKSTGMEPDKDWVYMGTLIHPLEDYEP
ncbi:hypothetical protein [Spirochaeta cellobiosiphila]|uniref:hypothetical protein n=1 Tax=Spirochaeta cellobiosiphila TaxID=504483 RepID=UPI000421CC98|nr:hypothetical protein [Spirochaeta cellobiosiphila]